MCAIALLSGVIDVALPPLIIYFTALGLAPAATTQILNLCFLAGRATRVVTFGGVGQFDTDFLIGSIPAIVAAVIGVVARGYLQSKIPPSAWRMLIRSILWRLTLVPVLQTI